MSEERHICDCSDCNPAPFIDRCKYEAALWEAHRQLSRYGVKGPKQIGRALLTMERALGIEDDPAPHAR